jgi:Domain of unknown function (DUF1906)
MSNTKHFRLYLAAVFLVSVFWPVNVRGVAEDLKQQSPADSARSYLGFDVNEYPGDAALPTLKQTFAFVGFWLNVPPGAKENNWMGKRAEFAQNGFGFLVLFNGRLERELKSASQAAQLGAIDAKAAAAAAHRERFPAGTIIFLDQEEGGRLLAEQMAYVLQWVETVKANGFGAGVYCSGMPAKEGKATIVTANDIRQHAGDRKITYFVYNDACPPSPGCTLRNNPPWPAESGVPFAAIWQFAQSPRRHEFTKSCRATYHADGNCYPRPNASTVITQQSGGILLDLDSATSADPSNGR